VLNIIRELLDFKQKTNLTNGLVELVLQGFGEDVEVERIGVSSLR